MHDVIVIGLGHVQCMMSLSLNWDTMHDVIDFAQPVSISVFNNYTTFHILSNQVTLGALLLTLPTPLLAVTYGLVGLWLLAFAVHETIFVCYGCFHENVDLKLK